MKTQKVKNSNTEPVKQVSAIKSFRFTLADVPNILGLFYLFAIGIGMLFTYQKYSEFGINIFDYADVFDFLIAPFADFTILLFTVSSLAIVYIVYLFDSWWSRNFSKSYSIVHFGVSKKSWFKFYRYSIFLISLIFYLYSASDYYGTISGEKVRKQPTIDIRFSDNETKNGVIIGKTNEIIFFLKGNNVTAIPITALVKEFEIK